MKSRRALRRKRTSGAKSHRGSALDTLILERSDTVLWTIAPPGVVLHNFAHRKYIQLDGPGYAAWGFLDGARTVAEVIDHCASAGNAEERRRVRRVVRTLVDNGFLVERMHA